MKLTNAEGTVENPW